MIADVAGSLPEPGRLPERVYTLPELRGWNVTGDVYVQDADGYFTYRCRSDDMIVSGGYKIPGPEVEAVLDEHPAVAESAVVAAPDTTRGFVAKAFVVLRAPHAPSPSLIVELQEHVKRELAPYKYPRAIEFVERLPRTETGKIQRYILRKADRERGGPRDGPPHPPTLGAPRETRGAPRSPSP